VDSQLRASSQSHTSFSWVAWLILECARRTSTFLSCAFREQEDDQVAHPILPAAEFFAVSFALAGASKNVDANVSCPSSITVTTLAMRQL